MTEKDTCETNLENSCLLYSAALRSHHVAGSRGPYEPRNLFPLARERLNIYSTVHMPLPLPRKAIFYKTE